MKRKNIEGVADAGVLESVGMNRAMVEEMYRVMAIADYEERFVIPTTHREASENAYELRGGSGISFGEGYAAGGLTGGASGAEGRRSLFNLPQAGQRNLRRRKGPA